MARNSTRRAKRESLTFDLTPLIDVVFLLLIFFMVSSVFKKEELALMLNLPKAQEGKGQGKKNDVVNIEITGQKIAYNGKEVDIEILESNLASLSKKTLLNLRVDEKVYYKRLVTILDLFQKNKLENISLITQKGNKK
ncbi:MAG: biopolymer transporter ExbD [Bacteriovoracaceae bacterium]|jgi:biopolymer transport protein ExbD|nr:biopolymer transporter ExbD [Bacteriovoracaceae bacterium]